MDAKELFQERMSKLGVLLTSHPKQQKFMDMGIKSWFNYPYGITLGYDNDSIPPELEQYKPPISDIFISDYPEGHLGHVKGELTLMKEGGRLLKEQGKEYIFKSAADTTCYRWYNFGRLFNVLLGREKYDFILCGTAVIFGRLDSFNKCMELFHPHFRTGGAELYLDSQIRAFDMKTKREKAPFWEPLLGRVHIQGEYAICNGIKIEQTWKEGKIWG
jgi:hypothetical protein